MLLTPLNFYPIQFYPSAIATTQRRILETSQLIESNRAYMSEIEAEIDLEISFSTELKNDAQRKAKRVVLLKNHANYQCHREALTALALKKDELVIELEQLKNEFSVVKIQARS